jgi:hypothetical protein
VVVFIVVKFCSISCFDPPCRFFWNNPAKNTDSPKLMEFISLNPKPLLVKIHVSLTVYNLTLVTINSSRISGADTRDRFSSISSWRGCYVIFHVKLLVFRREYVKDGVPKCEICVRIPEHPSCRAFQTRYHTAYGKELQDTCQKSSAPGSYRVLSDL